jgi:antitoxin (DNA-binding transcriptional repressor) of toxin-antitoxin stability system
MCHMRTASIRDVRHDFNRVLEWVANGEEVAITKRHQTVARLLPVKRKKVLRGKMPDIAARLKKVFGDRVIPDEAIKQILYEDRREY